MLADVLLLLVGLGLLAGGGEAMIRGAAAIARHLGIPPLVIGLTVVAFGTSAPELAVNVSAALRGSGSVAFGNVIGSNLANIGLILAVSAMFRNLTIHSAILVREIPMLLLASAAVIVMGFDVLRGDTTAGYDRPEGIVLLLLFAVFLYYTIAETLRRRSADPLVKQASKHAAGSRLRTLATSWVLLVLGLAGLIGGGQLTVTGAVEVAKALGVPDGVIGLTVVAVGTSLPELSASVIAARRGETDLAVGNVIGSNIFNLLFVLATTATIRPVPIPGGGHVDLIAMFVLSAVLLVLSLTQRRIARGEGAVLVVAYFAYIVWRAT